MAARGAVAHHARLDDGGRAFLRAVAADIGFEPQVPLPKIADLSVGRGDLVGVDFFLTGCGIQSLNLWGFCNGLRLFFFGHSQNCFLLTCQAFCSLVRNDKRPGCVNDFRAL